MVPLFIVPFALLLAYSFASQDYLTAKITFGWTLSAWKGLKSPIVYHALLRSLGLATAATAGCLLLGYPLAYFVARHAGRLRTIALIMIIIPFWVSFIIRAYALIALLSTTGPVNGALAEPAHHRHASATRVQLPRHRRSAWSTTTCR